MAPNPPCQLTVVVAVLFCDVVYAFSDIAIRAENSAKRGCSRTLAITMLESRPWRLTSCFPVTISFSSYSSPRCRRDSRLSSLPCAWLLPFQSPFQKGSRRPLPLLAPLHWQHRHQQCITVRVLSTLTFPSALTLKSNMATIPFHQVIRATTPVFTVMIYHILFQATYSTATYSSLLPVIAGVGFATYGDYAATLLGFVLTLLGAFLAAVKTVTTNRIQTGSLRLSAMEILHRMSPLALVQSLAFAYLSGEMARFRTEVLHKHRLGANMALVLLVNGAIAFGLNVISFAANKKVGALTMTVAANVKQILTIVLSVACFKLVVGLMHALGQLTSAGPGPRCKLTDVRTGIVLTLLGAGWYARVEMMERRSVVVKTIVDELEEGVGGEK